VRTRLPALADPLPPELTRVSTDTGPVAAGQAASGLNVADYAKIEECMRIPSSVWIATAEAGQRSGVLHFKLAGICMTLANYAAGGWARRPSAKQAKHGLESVTKVHAAGLFNEDQR
jgi:hypothetical protein